MNDRVAPHHACIWWSSAQLLAQGQEGDIKPHTLLGVTLSSCAPRLFEEVYAGLSLLPGACGTTAVVRNIT